MTQGLPNVPAGVARSMRGNRRRDTNPEMRLRRELHARGRRFRVDQRVDTGAKRCPRPDLLFTRWRVAVFVDGCFWHCCPEHGQPPKSNGGYWRPKLARNVERDAEDTAALSAAGWSVLRIWEHVSPGQAASLVEGALEAAGARAQPGRPSAGRSR